MHGVVLLDDSGGNPASVGHLNALPARPFSNGGEILARPRCPRTSRASRTCCSTADLGSRIEVWLESLRHCSSILLRQVDRVVDTIERKRNLACVLRAVEIVGDVSNRCLRHGPIVADGVRACLFDALRELVRRPANTHLGVSALFWCHPSGHWWSRVPRCAASNSSRGGASAFRCSAGRRGRARSHLPVALGRPPLLSSHTDRRRAGGRGPTRQRSVRRSTRTGSSRPPTCDRESATLGRSARLHR